MSLKLVIQIQMLIDNQLIIVTARDTGPVTEFREWIRSDIVFRVSIFDSVLRLSLSVVAECKYSAY